MSLASELPKAGFPANVHPSLSFFCVCGFQAHLADRDFTAERYEPVVIQMGAHQSTQLTEEERSRLEEEHKHRLTVPRRPPWTKDMTAEELDVEERNHFLQWRRTIAVAEEDTG